MRFSEHIHWLIQDYKAWRRGEKRVAPKGSTGRIYEKKNASTQQVDVSAGVAIPVSGNVTATLEMEVKRADGTVEHLSAPATVTKIPDKKL